MVGMKVPRRRLLARMFASVPCVAVDTVGVAFPIDEVAVRDVVASQPGRRLPLAGGGFVAVGVGSSAWVEASLPKRVRGENVAGIGVDEVAGVVREMVAEACEVVRPGPPRDVVGPDGLTRVVSVDDPRVVRLDLVRDFELADDSLLPVLLSGLASVPRSGAVKTRLFADGRTGRAETLRVGPGSWAATLYDKHRETGGLAPVGSLRAEFRLRGRQLTSARAQSLGGGVVTVSDVAEESCENLRRGWFELAGFGSWVGGRSSVWGALEVADLSDREKLSFVGWLSARADGVELSVCGKTDRKYRRLLGALQLGDGSSQRVRLDYERGCEEVAA